MIVGATIASRHSTLLKFECFSPIRFGGHVNNTCIYLRASVGWLKLLTKPLQCQSKVNDDIAIELSQ
jgi:hypothetical protein